MDRDKWRKLGLIIRWILYISNFIQWLAGIISIITGFVNGNESKLIQSSSVSHDIKFTTPESILIFYGSILCFVTIFGFFSAASANKWVIIVYLIFIIGIFVMDYFFLFQVFTKLNSFQQIVETIKKSIPKYRQAADKGFGLIPLPSVVFWDHVQIRGNCCGFNGYLDWSNTPYGKTNDLPASCCKKGSRIPGCGLKIFKYHGAGLITHPLSDVINDEGCSPMFQISNLDLIGKIAVGIGALIVLCFILAIIFLLLLIAKKYHPDWGIQSRQKRRLSQINLASDESEDAGPSGDTTTYRRSNKVAPLMVPSTHNERHTHSVYNSNANYDNDEDNYAPELKRKKLDTEDEPIHLSALGIPQRRDHHHYRPADTEDEPTEPRHLSPTGIKQKEDRHHSHHYKPADIGNSQYYLEEVSVIPMNEKRARLSN